MKKLFFLMIISIPLMLAAQQQKVGNISIFSEDGDKFYLVLNGEKQNDIARSNLRIEDLPQPYYTAKIIFADSAISPISKNNLMVANAEGTMMDVTYKIRKDKSNKAKLNYYSAIAVQQDFIPPAGLYVYQYGKTSIVEMNPGTISTTTTTKTEAATASISISNLNMSMGISEPSTRSTGTGSKTITSSNRNKIFNSNPGSKCNGWAMGSRDFTAALKTIAKSSFEDTKLSTAKNIASKNCLSSEQVAKICKLFSFEESKLAFAKFAYKHAIDQKNYFKVEDAFSFDTSKDELNKFTSNDYE